nr:unnamed protein product [Callosobruchus chinensis]
MKYFSPHPTFSRYTKPR